jgi:hypothetical protein
MQLAKPRWQIASLSAPLRRDLLAGAASTSARSLVLLRWTPVQPA